MSKNIRFIGIIVLLLVWSYFARPLYELFWIAVQRGRERLAEKNNPAAFAMPGDDVIALNTRVVGEVEQYLTKFRARPQPILEKIRYTSLVDYANSTLPLRAALRRSLGYPLSGRVEGNDFSTVREQPLGEDAIATYSLLSIPAVGDSGTGLVHSVGVLILPKKRSGKIPLIIAAHGRGGMPDLAQSGKIPVLQGSQRDLARGALERGWAVFEPIFLFYGKDYPEDIRYALALRAQQSGTSLLAMEFTKTERSIDYLLTRPEFDPERLAMVGISYGGFNTLYSTALDPRIRVAVVAAYFNDRAAVLDDAEPSGFMDWRFSQSTDLLRDPQIAALVCPRPLQIQAGTQDQLFPIAGARRASAEAGEYYRKLGSGSVFQYHEFVGRHDFDGPAAWDFIAQAFALQPVALPGQ